MSTTENKDSSFELKSADNAQFSNKCKNIFGNLEKLEKNHKEHEKSRPDEEDRNVLKSDPQDADMETITSAFKAPQPGSCTHRGGRPWRRQCDRADQRDGGPPPWRGRTGQLRDGRESDSLRREHQRRKFSGERRGHPYYNHKGNRRQSTPNYKVNPEKWTRYSLEDVGNEDMSESSNTRAAFAFLEERRKLREGEMKVEAVNTEDTSCSRGVFTFRKPVKRDIKKDNTKMSSNSVVQLSDSNDDCKDEQESADLVGNPEKIENEKVTFKSVKKSKRSIRSRDHADD
ncbi:uncharacterized protein LOC125648330 [Ostrea edulis]|uniref:uncharacterized protein LOC125648330 n=1 Tax=Ostrea edulis TaxID=37623 RepID=UPI0024AE8E9F|nr:uncharacterized protein LOC125648330 [Ostrea edulis]